MLNRIKQVFIFQLKQIRASPRIPLLFILIAIFVFVNVQSVSSFSSAVDIPATPWAFPHITSDYICQLVIMAGVVLLFCDAPFKNQAHLYILPRAGYIAWTVGICLYIVLLSFIYVMMVLLISIIALLPNLQFSSSWGRIWGTLARTTASVQFEIPFTVYDYLIGAYTPIRATVMSFLLTWACCVWIGLVIFFFNNLSGKALGSLIAVVFVLMDITVANEWTADFFRISPVTLAQLQALSRVQSNYGLTLTYAIKFFVTSFIILVPLCIMTPYAKKRLQLKHYRREKT